MAAWMQVSLPKRTFIFFLTVIRPDGNHITIANCVRTKCHLNSVVAVCPESSKSGVQCLPLCHALRANCFLWYKSIKWFPWDAETVQLEVKSMVSHETCVIAAKASLKEKWGSVIFNSQETQRPSKIKLSHLTGNKLLCLKVFSFRSFWITIKCTISLFQTENKKNKETLSIFAIEVESLRKNFISQCAVFGSGRVNFLHSG